MQGMLYPALKQAASVHAWPGKLLPQFASAYRTSAWQHDGTPIEHKPKSEEQVPGPGAPGADTPKDDRPIHPLMQRLPPIRDKLELAERDKALEALYPFCVSQLTPSLTESVRARLYWLWKGLLRTTGMNEKVQKFTTEMITSEVESDYSEEEFLEGAKEAYTSVMEAFGSKDYDSLKSMVSERALEAMQAAHKALEDKGLEVERVEAEVQDVYINGLNLWSTSTIQVFDKRWAEQAADSTSNSWLMLSVAVCSLLRVKLKVVGVTGASGVTGNQTLETSMSRSGCWLFVRGPLPNCRVNQLHPPWHVVAWW